MLLCTLRLTFLSQPPVLCISLLDHLALYLRHSSFPSRQGCLPTGPPLEVGRGQFYTFSAVTTLLTSPYCCSSTSVQLRIPRQVPPVFGELPSPEVPQIYKLCRVCT